jgi:hypothetical protein
MLATDTNNDSQASLSVNSDWKECRECGDDVHIERWALGYRLCLFCGEDAAAVERASWCIIQEYGKGNYQYVTPTTAFVSLRNTNQKQTRGDTA